MATATYSSDDMTVIFTAETERSDYGVPGSPIFYEINPDSVQIHSLEILGVEVKLSELPAALQSAILSLYSEVDWE